MDFWIYKNNRTEKSDRHSKVQRLAKEIEQALTSSIKNGRFAAQGFVLLSIQFSFSVDREFPL